MKHTNFFKSSKVCIITLCVVVMMSVYISTMGFENLSPLPFNGTLHQGLGKKEYNTLHQVVGKKEHDILHQGVGKKEYDTLHQWVGNKEYDTLHREVGKKEYDTLHQGLGKRKYDTLHQGVGKNEYEFNVSAHIMGDAIQIPGGGKILLNHNSSTPIQLPGMLLQPNLVLPTDKKAYLRRWPLKLTNLEYSFVLKPEHPCPSGTSLVGLVISKTTNFKTRLSIRSTWASPVISHSHWPGYDGSFDHIKIYFLLGSQLNMSTAEKDNTTESQWLHTIEKEYEQFGDIILCSFHDSYINLTLKTLMGLKWMAMYCPHVHFMMKVDEDKFVLLPAVNQFIEKYSNLKHAIIGN